MINHLLNGLAGELSLLDIYEPATLGGFLTGLGSDDTTDALTIIAAVWTRVAQTAAEKALDFNTPADNRIFNLGKLEAIRELCGELRSYLAAFSDSKERR